MIILDIDLDFFLGYIINYPKLERPDDYKNIAVNKKEEVIKFLEERCNLEKDRKIKGKFLATHDELFYWFRNLIERKLLNVPFEIIHIDAHADLGLGNSSYKYIMTELLHKPVSERVNPKKNERDGLSESNFLAFSIACRWINKITYVFHPRIIKSNIDTGWIHMKNFDVNSGAIQLKKIQLEEYEKHSLDISSCSILELEPEVPIDLIEANSFFTKDKLNYVFLTHSPKYTPREADKLIPVIMEYIDEKFIE